MTSETDGPRRRVIDELLAPVDEAVFMSNAWKAVQASRRQPPKKLVELVMRRSGDRTGDNEREIFALLAGRGDSDFAASWEIDRYMMRIEDFMPDDVLEEQQRAIVLAAALLDPLRLHRFETDFRSEGLR